MEYRYESATCKLTDHGDGTADLTHVYAQNRGQGHASGVVRLALEEADRRGLSVYLLVRGYGGPVRTMLSNDQLIEFYRKFGFERVDTSNSPRMKRPRRKNTSYDERED